jgi:hypothetical protein
LFIFFLFCNRHTHTYSITFIRHHSPGLLSINLLVVPSRESNSGMPVFNACMHVFNFSIPLLICVFSFLWKEMFHEGKAVYGKHVEIFLMFLFCSIQSEYSHVWRGNFLMFFFVPYKVNIPMYAGGSKQVPCKEYICWMQVKIHISDQTSLRICNSAPPPP